MSPTVRAAFDRLDHAVGDLDALSEELSYGIAASKPTTTPNQLAASVERIATGRGLNYDQVSSPAKRPT